MSPRAPGLVRRAARRVGRFDGFTLSAGASLFCSACIARLFVTVDTRHHSELGAKKVCTSSPTTSAKKPTFPRINLPEIEMRHAIILERRNVAGVLVVTGSCLFDISQLSIPPAPRLRSRPGSGKISDESVTICVICGFDPKKNTDARKTQSLGLLRFTWPHSSRLNAAPYTDPRSPGKTANRAGRHRSARRLPRSY